VCSGGPCADLCCRSRLSLAGELGEALMAKVEEFSQGVASLEAALQAEKDRKHALQEDKAALKRVSS